MYWKLVQKVKEGQECGQVVNFQADEIIKARRVELSQDSVRTKLSEINGVLSLENKTWEDRYNNQMKETDLQRKKKNKWIAGAVFAVVVIVGEAIFGN